MVSSSYHSIIRNTRLPSIKPAESVTRMVFLSQHWYFLREFPSPTFALPSSYPYCTSMAAAWVLLLWGVVDHRLWVVVELRHVWHFKDLLRGVALLDGGHNTVDYLERILGNGAMFSSKMIQHGTYL